MFMYTQFSKLLYSYIRKELLNVPMYSISEYCTEFVISDFLWGAADLGPLQSLPNTVQNDED